MTTIEQIYKKINAKEYDEAITELTSLIDSNQLPNASYPLFCRALCFVEKKQWENSKSDLLRIMQLDNLRMAHEILPGCYGTHVAAATMLAKAFKELGDKENEQKYLKLATEIGKAQADEVQKAIEIKDKANQVFKEGKVEEALYLYLEAHELDPTNSAVLSNACQMSMILGDYKQAEELVEKLVQLAPEWPKTWYRKGMLAMKQGRYRDAMYAFQQGITIAPEDADFKKLYMEASHLAEKTISEENKLNKQFMGMLMQFQNQSWPFLKYFERNSFKAKYWPTKSNPDYISKWWSENISSSISNPEFVKYQNMINELYELPTKLETFEDFIIPEEPLISLALLHNLLTIASPEHIDEWSFVWTFQATASSKHPLSEYISGNHIKKGHSTYALIVNREENTIFDFLGCWSLQKGWTGTCEDGLQEILKNSQMVYTCENDKLFFEYLEVFYELRDAVVNGTEKRKKETTVMQKKITQLLEKEKDDTISTAAEKEKVKKPMSGKHNRRMQYLLLLSFAVGMLSMSILYFIY